MPKRTAAARDIRVALLIYGLLNAVLYSGLLPLWDGFDEPYHYGYIQWVRQSASLPVLGKTPLPLEISRSLDYVPTSPAVWSNLHAGILFSTYFTLSPAQRSELRSHLNTLEPNQSLPSPSRLNYEAHQAPLAYLCLVPFDALWGRVPLCDRVFYLRCVASMVSVTLLWLAAIRLAARIALPVELSFVVLFVAFSSQMFYATVCRMGNDWLAIPAWTFLLLAAIEFHAMPNIRTGLRLMLWLAAGLLTKSYFLAGIPLALGLILLSCLRSRLAWWGGVLLAACGLGVAAPWYLRNIALYQNISGMQETRGGVPAVPLLAEIPHVPWMRSLLTTLNTALWTGNNSLFVFGAKTIALMEVALFAATALYLVRAVRSRIPVCERPLVAGTLCFILALAYSTVVTFWFTNGVGVSAAPWYLQPLLVPGFSLLLIGLTDFGLAGALLTQAILWLWAYVIVVTYVAKLIPFYAGFMMGRAHLSDLTMWWARLLRGDYGTLGTAALLSPNWIIALAIMDCIFVVALAATLSRMAFRGDGKQKDKEGY